MKMILFKKSFKKDIFSRIGVKIERTKKVLCHYYFYYFNPFISDHTMEYHR